MRHLSQGDRSAASTGTLALCWAGEVVMNSANKETRLVEHDPDARLVHLVNSELMEQLFGDGKGRGYLKPLLIHRGAWIINVLYAYASRRGSQVVLRTSSTYHDGALYDHRAQPSRAGVMAIDEAVPLHDSVSGRCVLSGRPIWLVKGELFEDGTFGDRFYRRFSLVEVDSLPLPKAELVFPIMARSATTGSVIGVVNLELFGQSPYISEEFVAHLPREAINELMSGVLAFHAPYLSLAADVLRESAADDESMIGEELGGSLSELHRKAISYYFKRNASRAEQVMTEVRRVAEEYGAAGDA